jgi:hypothetical protein
MVHWIFEFLTGARTPQDMDGTLTLIFGKSETSEDINTIISPIVYLSKI